MKSILADEGLNGQIVRSLREQGFTVDWVLEDQPGMSDAEIIEHPLSRFSPSGAAAFLPGGPVTDVQALRARRTSLGITAPCNSSRNIPIKHRALNIEHFLSLPFYPPEP